MKIVMTLLMTVFLAGCSLSGLIPNFSSPPANSKDLDADGCWDLYEEYECRRVTVLSHDGSSGGDFSEANEAIVPKKRIERNPDRTDEYCRESAVCVLIRLEPKYWEPESVHVSISVGTNGYLSPLTDYEVAGQSIEQPILVEIPQTETCTSPLEVREVIGFHIQIVEYLILCDWRPY